MLGCSGRWTRGLEVQNWTEAKGRGRKAGRSGQRMLLRSLFNSRREMDGKETQRAITRSMTGVIGGRRGRDTICRTVRYALHCPCLYALQI